MRTQIKSGDDLVFHLTRRVSDFKYNTSNDILKGIKNNLEESSKEKLPDPVVSTEGGMLFITTVGDKKEMIQKSIGNIMDKLSSRLGRR